MAKNKTQKKGMIQAYKSKLNEAKSVVILRVAGVTPNEATELRNHLFDFDSSFNVVKNTLFKIALKESDLGEEASLENSEHAAVFMKEDIVGPSKTLKTFITAAIDEEGNNKVEIVSGYLDGEKLTREQVVELAEMPTKEGSIAMILGILDQAIAGVANVLQNPVQSYVSVIDQAFKE